MSDELDLGQLGVSEFEEVELVQSSSKSAAYADVGKFYFKDSKLSLDSLTIVPLDFNTGRMWFLGKGTKYFCRSSDGKSPDPSDSPNYKQQSQACYTCPKSKWIKKTPPACKEYAEVLFANLSGTGSELIKITFRSTAYKDVIMALSEMGEKGGASRHSITITPQQMRTKTFDYWIPTFHNITKLDEEQENIISPLRSKYTKKVEENNQIESEYEVEDFNDGAEEDCIELDFE